MVMIFIYLLVSLYIILFDLMPIKKNNFNKLFGFNLIIICISFLVVILVGLDFKVPNPSDLIENIVKVFVQ